MKRAEIMARILNLRPGQAFKVTRLSEQQMASTIGKKLRAEGKTKHYVVTRMLDGFTGWLVGKVKPPTL